MGVRDWTDALHAAAAYVGGQSQRRASGMIGAQGPLEKKIDFLAASRRQGIKQQDRLDACVIDSRVPCCA